MSFTIKNVLELEIMKNARLLAGEKNIENPVLWINVMEILDSFDSLDRGELLITTGFGLNDPVLHRDTIMKISKKGLAGIAVQPGYYIDSVPEFIIHDAEKFNLPLIELPKKLTFSSVTRVILNNIGIYGKNPGSNIHIDSGLLTSVFKKRKLTNSEEQNIKQLLKHCPDKAFTFILLSFFDKGLGILDSTDASISFDSLVRELESIGITCLRGMINGYHGLLISINKEEVSSFLVEDYFNDIISKKHGDSIDNNVMTYAGISRCFSELSGIYQGFQEAESSLGRLQHSSAKKGALCFDNIELFRYLCGQYTDNAIQFVEQTLSPLYNNDRFHNSELIKTLRIFFRSNLNFQDSSRLLFIHRHTMKYRIKKIGELLNMDIGSHEAQFKLSLALYLDKYYK